MPVRRGRLRRWAPRAIGAAVVLSALAYATLPIWLPAGRISRLLERQLSAALDRPVSIEALSVSWIHGVELLGLAIADLPDADNDHLIRVARIRCDFTPLTTLFTGRVEALEVEGPELWLVRRSDGTLNIERLPTEPQPRLPALFYTIRKAVCHVWTPAARQSFRFDTLQCRIEPRSALLDVHGWAMPAPQSQATSGQPISRLAFDARITVPKLRPDREMVLGGAIRIGWSHIALSDLPLALVPRLPIEQVGGTTTGELAVHTHSDLTLDFSQSIALNGVRLAWEGLDRPALVPDALIRCDGRLDPNTDVLSLNHVECQTAAFYLRGTGLDGHAVQIDTTGALPLVARLEGRVSDWLLLEEEIPQLGSATENLGLRISGPNGFSLQMRLQGQDARATLQLDATETKLTVAQPERPLLVAGAGMPKRIEWVGDFRLPDGRIESSLEVQCGRSTLTATGSIPAAGAPVEPGGTSTVTPARLGLLKVAGQLQTAGIEDLLSLCPSLGTRLELRDWRGPLRLDFALEPQADRSRLHAAITALADAELAWGDWFLKAPGRPLMLVADVSLPRSLAGELRDLKLAAAYDGGTFTLTDDGTPLLLELTGKEKLTDAEPAPRSRVAGRARLEVTRLEAFAALFPRLGTGADPTGRRALAGDLSASVHGEHVQSGGESWSRAGIEIDAERLALRWGDELHKAAGDPLRLRGLVRCERGAQGCDDWLGVSIEQPSGAIEASLARGCSDTGEVGDEFTHLAVDAHILDLAAWSAGMPAVARAARRLQLSGAGDARFSAVVADGRPGAHLEIHARDAAFVIPGKTPLIKPAGQPAALKLRCEASLGGEPDEIILLLAAAQARLAGAELAELRGALTLRFPDVALNLAEPLQLLDSFANGLPAVIAGHLRGRGSATCGSEFDQLHPALAAWRERCSSSGDLLWEVEAGAGKQGASFALQLTGDDLEWNLSTGNPAVPTFQKARHVPARFNLAGACRLDEQVPHQRITTDAEFELDGNRVRLSGEVWASAGRSEAVDEAGRWLDSDLPASSVPPAPSQASPVASGLVATAASIETAPAVSDPLLSARPVWTLLDLSAPTAMETSPVVLARNDGTWSVPSFALGDSNWAVDIDIDRADRLITALPGTLVESLSGRSSIQLAVEAHGGRVDLAAVHGRFEGLTAIARGTTLSLDGGLAASPAWVDLRDLRWSLGDSDGRISGHLEPRAGGLTGKLSLSAGTLDVEDLGRQADTWRLDRDATAADDPERLRDLLRYLSRSQVDVSGHVDTFQARLPPGILVTAHAVLHDTYIARGPVGFDFTSAVQGGFVSGRVESRLDVPDPVMHLTYKADRLMPGPLVDEYLRRSFPGMTATGRLTLIDESFQKLIPGPGEANYPTGKGELIIEGGTVVGRAAPLAVARIFPGLNLARYDFSYMHSWFTKDDSGRIHHQMIYQGLYYNIYMAGYSEPTGVRYEVGIDFLADFNSKYWAESGQGRIPLFVKTGRIRPDGTLIDEEVSYMPPQRILDVLLVKNNPVITAYHAVRKRVRAEK